ncbi:diphthine synthase [Candidatus Woesearchaeota archaeon]|nr:diphthine synthase [Candidatus Woesearchaeota archaeon]
MTLYMIGLGLNDEKDITLKGLEAVKKCDYLYLEHYTSLLDCSIGDLEKLYGKKIILADRDIVEKNADEILTKAKENDVAFLVVGDVFSATTHIDFLTRAKDMTVKVEIIHNASIISAIGELGLEVYKFGKTTSIPFHHENVKAPIEVYEMNSKNGLHTLFLLDLDPKSNKFLSIKEAADYLLKGGIGEEQLTIGCSRLGSQTSMIKADSLKKIGKHDYGKAPYCLIIPGKLHFVEEEALTRFK